MSMRSPNVHSVYVPPRFYLVVAGHILKNITNTNYDTPLILGIHGLPGEGKTRQCELVFNRMGLECITISGGELENQKAGRPGELIRDRYREASKKFNKQKGLACVLLINDFDTGVGIWSDQTQRTVFQYTVNLQNVYATLMNIADHPTTVDNLECFRVPIIITGNNFHILHEPLIRDGRMVKFRWQPTTEEKVLVIRSIFADLNLRANAFEEFIGKYAGEKIAFFAHIKSAIIDEYLNDHIQKIGLDNILKEVFSNPNLLSIPSNLEVADLDRAATKVLAEHLGVQ